MKVLSKIGLDWIGLVAVICLSVVSRSVLGVGCGEPPTDGSFDAVGGIVPRCQGTGCPTAQGCVPPCIPDVFGPNWVPHGSCVLIAPNKIVAAKHVVDLNGTGSGACNSQSGRWYAYFRGCSESGGGSWGCLCSEDDGQDIIRVRVKCFTLAYGEFSGGDVVVGEIEPDDVECLAHITPMPISTPKRIGLCAGLPAYVAGWGATCGESCAITQAHSLHVALTTISKFMIDQDGRGGNFEFPEASCLPGGSPCPPCTPGPMDKDSGGALIVPNQYGTLTLVGVFQTATTASFSVAHPDTAAMIDLLSDEWFGTPCRNYDPCADMDGDRDTDIVDRGLLESAGEHAVRCFCLGDLDGDRVSGSTADLGFMNNCSSGTFGCPGCDRYRTCWGDADLDGDVDFDDADFVADRIGTTCPCNSCGNRYWCQGDVDCSGSVTQEDVDQVLASANFGHSCNWYDSDYPANPDCSLTDPNCPDPGCNTSP